MSISSIKNIKERILSAKQKSPIAVFKTDESGKYNAVFASTVKTSRLIQEGDSRLVGVFFGEQGVEAFSENIQP